MPLFAEVIPACAGVILKYISIVRTNVYHRVRKISPAAYGVLFALHMHALFFDAGVSLSLAQLFAYICLSGIAALVVWFWRRVCGACTRIAHVFEACPRLAKAVA